MADRRSWQGEGQDGANRLQIMEAFVKSFMILLAVLTFGSQLWAVSATTAGELHADCVIEVRNADKTSDPGSVAALKGGLCLGFLEGWLQGEQDSLDFEDGITVGQVERMFMQFMPQYPSLENLPAGIVLREMVKRSLVKQ